MPAQDGIGLSADVAQHRNRHLAPLVARHRILEAEAGHAVKPVELRAGNREADTGEFGPVERAGRTLEIAVDGERGSLLVAAQFGRDEIAAVGRRDQRLRRDRGYRHKNTAERQRANRNRGAGQSDENRAAQSERIWVHLTLRVALRS